MSAGGRIAGARHLIAKLIEKAGVRRSLRVIRREAQKSLSTAQEAVLRDTARRGEAQAPKEVLSSLESKLVGRMSNGQRAAVREFANRAAAAEKSITPRVTDAAKRVPGARMAPANWREFRLKSSSSLERKVAVEVQSGEHVDSVLGEVKDSIRYTMEIPHGDYARGAQSAMDQMEAAGFEPVGDLKNSWGNETGYRGINSVWRDPQTGHTFEVQFHSEVSLAAKEITHPIYDFKRLPELDSGVRDHLERLQNNVFDKVPIPKGASDVRWPT